MTPLAQTDGAPDITGPRDMAPRALAHALWVLTLVLIFMGALVKSHDAGLSVPDWPTTYGQNMFLFPPSQWRANIFYEHTHRLAASLVGLLTLVLCGWVLLRDGRGWARACAVAAVVLVVVQGLLGGLTVLLLLPAAVSVAHGVLAQSFLLVAVFLAYGYAKRRSPGDATGRGRAASRWALALVTVVWIQLVIGAVVRHTESGLAVPDFPTMGGQWVPRFDHEMLGRINRWRLDRAFASGAQLPDVTAGQAMVHVVHRVSALAVAAAALGLLRASRKAGRAVARVSLGAVTLVALQIALGILTVLTERQPIITSLHVVTGACLLATAWYCALRAMPDREVCDTNVSAAPAAG